MNFCVFSWPILLYFFSTVNLGICLEYTAYISDNGLHGTISFIEEKQQIKVITNLNGTLQFPTQSWKWSLQELPVDYSISKKRCDNLGQKVLSFDENFGNLLIPENGTSEFILETAETVFDRSLLLENPYGNIICASIVLQNVQSERTAVANFHSPVGGNVYFHWFATKNHEKQMFIRTNLFLLKNVEKINLTTSDFTEHHWKLYTTDILENEKSDINCNTLQAIFDPDARDFGRALGDIDNRVGKIRISTNYKRKQFQVSFKDNILELLPGDIAGPQRKLFLVIFENVHSDSFLACAKIRYDVPSAAKAIIQSAGIKGEVKFSQRTRFEPTFLNFNLSTSRGDLETQIIYASSISSFKIHELPMKPISKQEQLANRCYTTKNVFNPLEIQNSPPNGFGTQDQYAIGDLSGKHLNRNNETLIIPGSNELKGTYWDVHLSLIGKDSIIYRSLVIYKNAQEAGKMPLPWICGIVTPYESNFKQEKEVISAQVIFRYPLVGRAIFRQVEDDPLMDTYVFLEYLVHADGSSLNNSMDHRWAIHENAPGKDFYNWTARCVSCGGIFNPYNVEFDNRTKDQECDANIASGCRIGDLSSRLGTLSIAGQKVDSDRIVRKLITDSNLPLSGSASIIGKSFVIYDDFGPKARGDRLACSIIGRKYRRKAVAKDWFPNGDPLTVKGKLEFIQQSEYDLTNVEVNLEGLKDCSGYHVHITSVEENLEFPCERSSLYDHWNPFQVNADFSPRLYRGTPDQYEMGDLSGKYGYLDNQTVIFDTYNDTLLPLFGPSGVLGRSIVIHKRVRNQRWACATIERGYSPSEARELRAIASFHHPQGFAYGYIKMTQLVYNDGSMSETIIETKLRHPGKHDRNVTRDHNWAIFVNPVGVDAAVQSTKTRCVAAGYVWNPYYTQLADPLNQELYNKECGPDNPFRCYVGDMSARLGTIDIGVERKIFSDPNLPLEGPISALGRSVVIKAPNKINENFACANIEPDYDIVKFANIERPPRFVIAQFVEDLRDVLGVPPWMLTVDTRKTKALYNNACIQLVFHMKGPLAFQLEMDFSKLLSSGRLDSPTLFIPGFIDSKRKSKISYKLCGINDPNEKKTKKRKPNLQLLGLYNSAYIHRDTESAMVLFIISKFLLSFFNIC